MLFNAYSYQDKVDFTDNCINNETQAVITNLFIANKMVKKGYPDAFMNIVALVLPMNKGIVLGACPLLPKGLHTDKLRSLTEAQVNTLLEDVALTNFEQEDIAVKDKRAAKGAKRSAGDAGTAMPERETMTIVDEIDSFILYLKKTHPENPHLEAYKLICLQAMPTLY